MVLSDVIFYSSVVSDLCSSANKCLLKVAQFSAQRELFERAAEIYEQVNISMFVVKFYKLINICAFFIVMHMYNVSIHIE